MIAEIIKDGKNAAKATARPKDKIIITFNSSVFYEITEGDEPDSLEIIKYKDGLGYPVAFEKGTPYFTIIT